jgi:hypothetical protein
MLKYLAIFAIATLVAISVSGQPDKAADHKQDKAQQNAQPVPAPKAPDEKTQGATHQASPNPDPPQRDTPLKRPEWWAVAIAITTLIAVGYQAWLMRDTARRQLRAYVVVERGIVANVADPPAMPGEKIETVARIMNPRAGPHAQITIKNTGQTPAYNLVHWAGIGLFEWPLKTILPSTMPKPDSNYWNVLGPDVPEVKTLRMPQRLSSDQIQGLNNGKMAIYCYGEIRYKDAFKKTRFTRYRCMYATPHCGIIGIGTDLVYCEEGNEAD